MVCVNGLCVLFDSFIVIVSVIKKGEQYDYVQHWGEGFAKMQQTGVFIVDIASNSIKHVQGFSTENYSWAQVQWQPSGDGLVAVGYHHRPRRLGLRHYNTRPSSLAYLPIDAIDSAEGSFVDLAPDDHSPS